MKQKNRVLHFAASGVAVIFMVAIAYGAFHAWLLTRGQSLVDRSAGVAQSKNGIRVHRNPATLFGTTEFIRESANSARVEGGVLMGKQQVYEIRKGFEHSYDFGRVTSPDGRISFMVADSTKNGQPDWLAIKIATGPTPFEYHDLNLDGQFDMMTENPGGADEQLYILIDDAWVPAIECGATEAAIVNGDLYVLTEGLWQPVFRITGQLPATCSTGRTSRSSTAATANGAV